MNIMAIEEHIKYATNTLAKYCKSVECCDCKIKFWCLIIRRGFRIEYANEAEQYNTPDKMLNRCIEAGWTEIKVKNDDIRIFQNVCHDGELVQVAVPVDEYVIGCDEILACSMKGILKYENSFK